MVEAISDLRQRGVNAVAMLAGAQFQHDYVEQIQMFIQKNHLQEQVQLVKPLSRAQLSRFFRLQHVGVFPSIHPEAFGIVTAEIMASGLALVTSGVGGAGEILEPEVSGLKFKCGDGYDLADQLERLVTGLRLLETLQIAGEEWVRTRFDLSISVKGLETLLRNKMLANATWADSSAATDQL